MKNFENVKFKWKFRDYQLRVLNNADAIELEATIQEQNIFNQAVNEMLSPIENPRYVLVFKKYKKLDYKNSFACPAIFGQKKEIVEVFKNNLRGRIGEFEILYTRNEIGRKKLIKCKKQSFITKNEMALKRKKKISVFE